MSKTGQCLKTLNGGNLGTVQEFWDSSGFLGQDSVENLLKFKRNFAIEQTLSEFDFFEPIGLCFKYILIFLVGIC